MVERWKEALTIKSCALGIWSPEQTPRKYPFTALDVFSFTLIHGLPIRYPTGFLSVVFEKNVNISERLKGFLVTHIIVRISPVKLLYPEHLSGFSYAEIVSFGGRKRGDFSNSVPLGMERSLQEPRN